jgi:hypothetical protein
MIIDDQEMMIGENGFGNYNPEYLYYPLWQVTPCNRISINGVIRRGRPRREIVSARLLPGGFVGVAAIKEVFACVYR